MDWSFIWKTVIIVIVGTALVRIAGRKSVSQLTIAQTVIMVSIGTLLIQPVVGKNVWFTFLIAAVMIGTLIVMEYAQLKLDVAESIITGKSKILIENGQLNEKNLSSLRMSVDQLEMKLRQKNVTKLNDVKWATMEANGQLGFMLKDAAQPVTKGDLQQLSGQLNQSLNTLLAGNTNQSFNQTSQPTPNSEQPSQPPGGNIFKEVSEKEHQTPPPKRLQ